MQNYEALYYNSVDFFDRDTSRWYREHGDTIPGLELCSATFRLFTLNVGAVDRTGIVKHPIRTHTIDACAMPTFVPINYSYEDACNIRATQIWNHIEASNRKVALMWSGGIDSTTALVSLLKNSTSHQRENMVVLMSEDTIRENSFFYKKFIRGQMQIDHSYNFHNYAGNDSYFFTSGECNDQLLGYALIKVYADWSGDFSRVHETIHRPEVQQRVCNFISTVAKVPIESAYKIFNIYKNCSDQAPVPIDSVYSFFWWWNFCFKWQNVYVRGLSFLPQSSITGIKFEENFSPFYSSASFQLWSLNNVDELASDSWSSYKSNCKDIIYKFDGNEDYRVNKLRTGSFVNVVSRTKPRCLVDRNMVQYDLTDPNIDLFIDRNNSFV
jgi:hypothetical protein